MILAKPVLAKRFRAKTIRALADISTKPDDLGRPGHIFPLRAKRGAFSAINYGTRPVGALLGGFLGSALGLRPALWIAVVGGVLGAALLVPSLLPRYRLPGHPAETA